MIFITLGSQKFQFNRLLKAIDGLIEKGEIKDPVFAQKGYSDYIPRNYKYKDFLSRDEFAEAIGQADIVLTHGGTGAIIGAVKQGKKVVAVPRLARYGEHVDDHQMQLLEQFDGMEIIETCYDMEKLGESLQKVKDMTYMPYVSNTDKIIENIEKYIADIE